VPFTLAKCSLDYWLVAANWMTRLQPWSLHVGDLIRPVNRSRWISATEWAFINAAIVKQCDNDDGVLDGVITDPKSCNFSFDSLACAAKQISGCLSADQIAAAKLVYVDYYEGDHFIFNSMNLGSELVFAVLLGEMPSGIAVSYFQNMIYNDTTWNPDSYDYASSVLSDSINPGGMNVSRLCRKVSSNIDVYVRQANDPDLSSFTDKGGKVLHYVGLADVSYLTNCE